MENITVVFILTVICVVKYIRVMCTLKYDTTVMCTLFIFQMTGTSMRPKHLDIFYFIVVRFISSIYLKKFLKFKDHCNINVGVLENC